MMDRTQPLPNIHKIAVLRASSGLGDHIAAYPALWALRSAYPEAEIVYLGNSWQKRFIDSRPGPIDRAIVVPCQSGVRDEPGCADNPAELDTFFANMHDERFDLAIQMHGGGRNSLSVQGVAEHRERLKEVIDEHCLASELRPLEARVLAAQREKKSGARVDLGEMRERRLLARIHRYTLNRLRQEIEPVVSADFMRFLFHWQRATPEQRGEGQDALAAVIDQLAGFEAPAVAAKGFTARTDAPIFGKTLGITLDAAPNE